ncbi:MAG: hypothetical protein ACXIUL_00715 [Wenzhouxiangella sp.]
MKRFLFSFVLLAMSVPAMANFAAYQQFMNDGGDWLLGQQNADGSFPWTANQPGSNFVNVQAPAGLGMLSVHQITNRPEFLQAAIDVGDYLVANQATHADGTPIFRSYDPYFFTRLSAQSGDSSYQDLLDSQFWGRIEAGIYGPNGDWGIEDYVAAEIARRANQNNTAVAAWDLALVIVAGSESGWEQFHPALMDGVRLALESTPDTSFALGAAGFDVLALVGGVWAGGVTGMSAVPADGAFAGAATNEDLIGILLSYQSDLGTFLQSSLALDDPIDPELTIAQTTAFGLLALQSYGGSNYFGPIRRALEGLIFFQEADGFIFNYHPNTDPADVPGSGTALAHAYALQAFAETQGTQPPAVGVPVANGPWLWLMMLSLMLAGLLVMRSR